MGQELSDDILENRANQIAMLCLSGAKGDEFKAFSEFFTEEYRRQNKEMDNRSRNSRISPHIKTLSLEDEIDNFLGNGVCKELVSDGKGWKYNLNRMEEVIGSIDKDSDYFESLYDYITNVSFRDSSLSKEEIRLKVDPWYWERMATIERVTNQDFLKKIVDEVPNDHHFMINSPHAYAVGLITDQEFLEHVINEKSDRFMIYAALGRLTNEEILQRYASISDDDCNSFGLKYGTPEEIKARANQMCRDVAVKRLDKLKYIKNFQIPKDKRNEYTDYLIELLPEEAKTSKDRISNVMDKYKGLDLNAFSVLARAGELNKLNEFVEKLEGYNHNNFKETDNFFIQCYKELDHYKILKNYE